jgi:hypothetical protein
VEIRGDGYLIAEHEFLVEPFGVPIPAAGENKREVEEDDLRQWPAIHHEFLADSGSYSYMAEMVNYVFTVADSRRPVAEMSAVQLSKTASTDLHLSVG